MGLLADKDAVVILWRGRPRVERRGRESVVRLPKVTHPRFEVHGSASVEQQSGYVDVPVVSGDVQRREPALKARGEEEE